MEFPLKVIIMTLFATLFLLTGCEQGPSEIVQKTMKSSSEVKEVEKEKVEESLEDEPVEVEEIDINKEREETPDDTVLENEPEEVVQEEIEEETEEIVEEIMEAENNESEQNITEVVEVESYPLLEIDLEITLILEEEKEDGSLEFSLDYSDMDQVFEGGTYSGGIVYTREEISAATPENEGVVSITAGVLSSNPSDFPYREDSITVPEAYVKEGTFWYLLTIETEAEARTFLSENVYFHEVVPGEVPDPTFNGLDDCNFDQGCFTSNIASDTSSKVIYYDSLYDQNATVEFEVLGSSGYYASRTTYFFEELNGTISSVCTFQDKQEFSDTFVEWTQGTYNSNQVSEAECIVS